MRLKRLELQGFKTFASRTELVFDSGITAIVGPNGSGKSNLADAVRWVLGEQSYHLLRARRTEDMIFSGSQQRARQGMAQVTLILDNSSGHLPLDFTEVSITRRAYRSGENEYLLNGQRMRLRDVQDLLASSGLARRSYTVIGQGLIDQALSLRPEERRLLFEEAAGIVAHQAKRDEALRRLDETQANLVRVQDLLREMEPRLRALERQAQRAEERRQVAADLEAALRLWYSYQWQQALQQLERAQVAATTVAAAVTHQQEELTAIEAQISRLRERQAVLRAQLSEWHRQNSEMHRQAEEVQRQLAVVSERQRLLGIQAEELTQEVSSLRRRAEAQAQQLAVAQQALEEARTRAEMAAQAAREAQQAAAAEEAAHRSQQQAYERAQAAWVRASIAVDELCRRIAEAEARAQASTQERADHLAQLAQAEAEIVRLEEAMQKVQAMLLECDQRAKAIRDALAASRATAEQARQAERVAAAELTTAQRRLDQLQTKWDLLERLREEGAGLQAGVRAVVQAARSEPCRLSGILGTVGELLRVPPELERAIEIALGGRLQDLVVERWQDAEAAIAYLKQTQGGRATFLPLDHLRPPRPLSAPRIAGVRGMASDLVQADPRLREVIQLLLGRTVIVEDLPTARRVFAQMRAGVQVVTLEGDIVRPGGSVTGGSEDGRRSGVLTRERERRELPRQIQAAAEAVAKAQQQVAHWQEAQRRAVAEMTAHERVWQEIVAQQATLQRQLQDYQRALDRARQTAEWRRSLAEQAGRQAEEAAQRVTHLQAELADLERECAARAEELSRAEAALAASATRESSTRAAEAQALAAAAEVEQRSQERLVQQAEETLRRIEAERHERERRLAELMAEQERLGSELAELKTAAETLQAQIDQLTGWITSAEAEADHLASEQAAAESHEALIRQKLRLEEARHQQMLLALQRAQDELNRLRREIDHELGPVMMELGTEKVDQPPLPLPELVESLPVVTSLPEGLEQEIRRLRAHLARLGNVNPNAPAEYAETLERYTFLSKQLADLHEAVARLQRVIADLNALMERDFQRTFDQVAERFREYFTRLFGGGSARLVLTDPDHLSATGVEIVAHLPGKRAQSLALLSGGERSLTAAALIFALLEVNPPPFCVLDEVDAALDEANVGRFREALRALAERIQFILITHNRGTIEVADTIYGISMGADGVSQVLSISMKAMAEVT
ncbi:MAG: chromosome segregation protein SMC [Anaerolineae bacterium]|nr:chromosome segregation protein SMC [Anaerolineae bacterium]MDW8100868.1 chromosome segregation protein SMC [Anaerolineae bacterium]